MRKYPIGYPNRWEIIANNFKCDMPKSKEDIIKFSKIIMRREKIKMFKTSEEGKIYKDNKRKTK